MSNNGPGPDDSTAPFLTHTRSIEVSWGDCDAAGVVFYPRYYAWFDACTHALLSCVGLDHHTLRDRYDLLGTPLVNASANFSSPATYGDELVAHSTIAKLGRSSFTVMHRFFLGQRLVVEGQEVRVWAQKGEGSAMQTQPIPETVRRLLMGEPKS